MRRDATLAAGLSLEDTTLSVALCPFYEPTAKCILESRLAESIAARRDITLLKAYVSLTMGCITGRLLQTRFYFLIQRTSSDGAWRSSLTRTLWIY